MPDGADLTFEELDRVVQGAHTRKRKRKKPKTTKKTSTKKHNTAHKAKSDHKAKSAHKPKDDTSHHKKAKSDTDHTSAEKKATEHPKSDRRKKVSRSRTVARSARAMHAKKSAATNGRVRRSVERKKAEKAEQKASKVTVKSVPAKKKKHAKPEPAEHKPQAKAPDAVIHGQGRKLKPAAHAKAKPLITNTPPMFNRIGVDTKERNASEVQVRVGRPTSKPPENPGLLSDLTKEKSSLPPHKPVGHVSSERVESSLTDLYDDTKPNAAKEAKAEAVEAEYKAEHQPRADTAEEVSLGVHSSDHHKVRTRKGWVTAFDHMLNIVITTLFLVIVAFFIIVQLGWFDIGLDPVF